MIKTANQYQFLVGQQVWSMMIKRLNQSVIFKNQ